MAKTKFSKPKKKKEIDAPPPDPVPPIVEEHATKETEITDKCSKSVEEDGEKLDEVEDVGEDADGDDVEEEEYGGEDADGEDVEEEDDSGDDVNEEDSGDDVNEEDVEDGEDDGENVEDGEDDGEDVEDGEDDGEDVEDGEEDNENGNEEEDDGETDEEEEDGDDAEIDEEGEGDEVTEEESEPMQPLGMWFPNSEYGKGMKFGTKCYIKKAVKKLESVLKPEEMEWFTEHPQFRHFFHMPKETNHKSMGMWMLLLHMAKTDKKREFGLW